MDKRKGSVLVFVLVLSIMVAGAVAVILSTTVVQARVSRENGMRIKAFHNANAGLDYIGYFIKASQYQKNGKNMWLWNHSSDTGKTVTSADCPELANIGATITITRVTSDSPWYHIESRVPVKSGGLDRIVEVWVREREPFSEYMFFVGGSISFGETSVSGKVHCNGYISFNEKCRKPGTNEPAKFWGETTAVTGSNCKWWSNADRKELFTIYNESNGSVSYQSEHDFGVEARDMPETTDIDALYNLCEAGYSADSTIEFVTTVDSGKYVTKVKLDGVEKDLPANGVIACDSSNVKITGTTEGVSYGVATINGRVTIVNKKGHVYISSPIIYIDEDGNSYYQHRDSAGNTYDYATEDYFEEAGKNYWTMDTNPKVQFVRNPSYNGNSAVGIVAAGDVRYGVSTSTKTSMEIDAAILGSGFGHWHDNKKKRNLRVVGSLTYTTNYGRYYPPVGTGKGYSYSGIYQYDHKLKGNAPPHFLGTSRPEFFAWRVVH